MDGVEHEICNNCKKEIPQQNYVMHTMHCARNITLCNVCKEPIPKAQYADHEVNCKPKPVKKPSPPPTNLERSSYFQTRKAIEDRKAEARKERYLQKMDRLVDSGFSLSSDRRSSYTRSSSIGGDSNSSYGSRLYSSEQNSTRPNQNGIAKIETPIKTEVTPPNESRPSVTGAVKKPETKPPSGMLACKFCDLDLPKLELDEHENYCGSRTDKCLECGELVMFRDKQSHMDSNHSHLKKRGQNAPSSWDSATQRTGSDNNMDSPRRNRQAFRNFADFDYDPMAYLPSVYQSPTGVKKKEGESYKEISRRLDCKTEYIRNLLHDSAGITVPLRRSATTPRNHFNHNKGPAPQPPPSYYRRRNPPTELVIPCEFCGVPVPHEDLIEHETGCRPDLARFNPRRRVRSPDDDEYFSAGAAGATSAGVASYTPPTPSSPDEELPCEFCGDMIPASQLWTHQIRCT